MLAKLQQRFSTLTEDEQLVMLVLAVVYAPISHANLQALFKKIGDLRPQLPAVSHKLLRDNLQQSGLLKISADGWQCNMDVSEFLMKQAAQQSWFKPLAATIIADRNSYYLNRLAVFNAVKQLRIFLYQGNELAFSANLERFYLDFPNYFIDVFKRLFFIDFDADWFGNLAEPIRFLILKYYLNVCSLELLACEQEYQLLENYFGQQKPENPAIAHCLIEQRFLRGNMQDAAKWLAGDYSADGLKLLATLKFFANDNETAIELYNLALKTYRKTTGKRSATLEGLHGLFFYLALLKSRNPTHIAALKQYLSSNIKASHAQNAFLGLHLILRDALNLYQGKTTLDKCTYFLNSGELPYERLFHTFLLYWLGEIELVIKNKKNAAFLSKLADYCQRAQEHGYFWYASVSALLLQRIAYDNAQCLNLAAVYKTSPFSLLLDLLPQISPWERALDALTHLRDETANSDSPAELRLVWLLTLNNEKLIIEPREQKLSKNGTWSKGRPVALKRLLHEQQELEYLTAQDRNISNYIEIDRDCSYYGYYGKDNYIINPKAIIELAGHPAVFWAEQVQYQNPVEINIAEPQLLVKEKDSQYHISIHPEITGQDLIAQRTATGLLIFMINDKHRQVAEILGAQGLTVPAGARQKVLDTIASVACMLTIQSDIGGDTTHAETVEADSQLHVHLQPIGKGIMIEIFVQPFTAGGPLYKPGQGGATVLAEIEGTKLQTTRNSELELQNLQTVLAACPELYEDSQLKWSLDDPEQALEALLHLKELAETVILEWPKGKQIRISRETGLSQAKFSVRKEKDWFSVEGGLQIDEQQVIDMHRLLQLLNDSPGRFLRLDDGQIIALTKELRQRLDDLAGLGDLRGDKVHFHALSAPALGEITQGMDLVASKSWLEQLDKLDALDEINPTIPSTLQGSLRDYQVEGYIWMSRLAHWGAGACLADDMGLGKTIQALALILSRAPAGPTLILAPTSVCINWMEECQRFAPTLNVTQFGSGDRQSMLADAGPFDLIICSYGLLQTEAERLAEKHWHTLVADEAQAIKNALTKRSKAAMALQADFKLITTGTPIENHLGELWNLFNFINPGLLGSLQKFNERYAQAIENQNDLGTQKRLRKLLRPFILRRLKNDVLTELPSRTEVTLHIELSPEERTMYEALRRSALQSMQEAVEQPGQQHLKVLAEIMKLRRACCHPRLVMSESPLSSSKLQAFAELVEELLDNRHKALVFSQFVGHLEIIRELLDNKGIYYHYLDGSTPVAQRKKAMNAFQAGDGDLFLISLKAGGTGLNLTAADYVIHMDPWWNPAVEDQASDRAHRMGQKRPVTIYRLVAKDTIEDKIVELHKHKRDLANSLLEGGDVSGKLSFEDMLELLKDVY